MQSTAALPWVNRVTFVGYEGAYGIWHMATAVAKSFDAAICPRLFLISSLLSFCSFCFLKERIALMN